MADPVTQKKTQGEHRKESGNGRALLKGLCLGNVSKQERLLVHLLSAFSLSPITPAAQDPN